MFSLQDNHHWQWESPLYHRITFNDGYLCLKKPLNLLIPHFSDLLHKNHKIYDTFPVSVARSLHLDKLYFNKLKCCQRLKRLSPNINI